MKPTRPGQGSRSPSAGPARNAGSAGAAGSNPALRVGGATWRFIRRRPGVVLAVVATVGIGGAVARNALTQQANRHPAPLFGPRPAAAAVEPPRRPEFSASLPLPAPRPEMAVTTTQSIPEPPRPAAADPIGSLIRTGNAASKTSEARNADGGRVLTAQKALAKLGYGPLKADGLMGLTTKQALERFERDHNLPLTGGLGTRTTRQLASASGLPIE